MQSFTNSNQINQLMGRHNMSSLENQNYAPFEEFIIKEESSMSVSRVEKQND